MEIPGMLPSYEFPPLLALLVTDCERNCMAGCCGICAFDFSPLHVASHISTHGGSISKEGIWGPDSFLAQVEMDARLMKPDENGLIFYNEAMNHSFTFAGLLDMLDKIRHALAAVPAMQKLSRELEWKEPDPAPGSKPDRPFTGKLMGSWRVARTTEAAYNANLRTILHFCVDGNVRHEVDDPSGKRTMMRMKYVHEVSVLKMRTDMVWRGCVLTAEDDGSVKLTDSLATWWLVRLGEPEPYSRWFVDEKGRLAQVGEKNG